MPNTDSTGQPNNTVSAPPADSTEHVNIGNLADIMQAIQTLVLQLPYSAVVETDTGKIPVNATLEALVEQANRMVLQMMESA